ncbi:MAG: ABC transporter permease [Bacteroidota bacterium]|nr:ABC transporter permease [Bacteroidota bacterium]MDX5431024.1 ABC transporter permease [Bacteroidota bacterium]MDX5469775.1 ABC transporter permease [Bacteroidota bacterium]
MSFLVYFGKRLAYSLLTLWGVVSLVFLLFNVLPDPAQLTMGQRTDAKSIEAAKEEMGLDLPAYQRYLHYLNDLSPLHFSKKENPRSRLEFQLGSQFISIQTPFLRSSYQSKKAVTSILAEAMEGTTVLALSSISIAILFGIGLGVISALYKETWIDRGVLAMSTLGISLPSFFAAILIAWFFGYVLHAYTGLNMTGSLVDYSLEAGRHYVWKNLLLPSIALGIRPLAIITQLTRSSMLDVLNMDYIITARAKGLSERSVLIRHALPNALNPVVTSISGWFASLLAGAFFVEYIFNWKGLGKVTVEALEKSDYPVVMGSVLLVAVIFILINLGVDLIYKRLDPRIQLS